MSADQGIQGFEGWVLDTTAAPVVVAHFTACSQESFEQVADSYRRGYPEECFVVVSETPREQSER